MLKRRIAISILIGLVAGACDATQLDPDCSTGGVAALPLEDQPIAVELVEIAAAESPTSLVFAPTGPEALWVTERRGRLLEINPDARVEVLIDLTSEVSTEGEGGLLDVEVHPDDSRLSISYTTTDRLMRVVSYPLVAGRPDLADEAEHLTVELPSMLHTGGAMMFGPDSMLYVGVGDGASPDQPEEQTVAQQMTGPRGKILRIDPLPSGGYRIPEGNPYPDSETPETWLLGLRNPWGFSFDPATGDLWLADVGEGCWEEINRIPADTGGSNMGWPILEGTARRNGDLPAAYLPPVYEYRHTGPASAVIGGVIYRGSAIPDLVGKYLFGDYGQGTIFALSTDEDITVERLSVSLPRPTRFATRPDGEVIVMSETAGIFLLTPGTGGE